MDAADGMHTIRIVTERAEFDYPAHTRFVPDDPRHPYGIGPGRRVAERGYPLYQARFVCSCGWTEVDDLGRWRYPIDAERSAARHMPKCPKRRTQR